MNRIYAIPAFFLMAVLLVSGCAQTTTNTGSGSQPPSTTTPPAAGTGPKEVYMAYRQGFDQCNSFDDFLALMQTYGSASQMSSMQQTEGLSESLKQTVFNMAKSMSPSASDISNIDEQITGDSATLTVSVSDGSMTGTVTMAKEDGVWKIEKDSWKNT